MYKLIVVLFGSLLYTGCATNGDIQRLNDQITTIKVNQKILKDSVSLLNIKLADLENQIEKTNESLYEMEDNIKSLSAKFDKAFLKNASK